MAWTGIKNAAIIIARVNNLSAFPADVVNIVQRKIFSDVDATGFDRSLRAYIRTVSSGRADLQGRVFGPYDVVPWMDANGKFDCAGTMNLAIRTAGLDTENPTANNVAVRQAQGLIIGFEYACVIFPDSAPCTAHAFWGLGPDHFHPGSTVIGCCHLNLSDRLGAYAMENIHCIGSFADLYGIPDAPGRFDEMDCACGVHPSTYTKLALDWMAPTEVVSIGIATAAEFDIEALSVPVTSGRCHAIRINTFDLGVYFLIEARAHSDRYESGMQAVSAGIPAEGVVIYRVDEGSWPPLHLLYFGLNAPGASYTESVNKLKIEVTAKVGTTFRVSITPQQDFLHLLVVGFDGRLYHTIRYGTSWQPFGDVIGAASDPGKIFRTDCARIGDQLHVVALTGDQSGLKIWHTVRYPTYWDPFRDVKGASSDPGRIEDVSVAEVNGELHVCAMTEDGNLWHSIRHVNSNWDPFRSVKGAASDPGHITHVSVAAVRGELHVCAVTKDGNLWHTIPYDMERHGIRFAV